MGAAIRGAMLLLAVDEEGDGGRAAPLPLRASATCGVSRARAPRSHRRRLVAEAPPEQIGDLAAIFAEVRLGGAGVPALRPAPRVHGEVVLPACDDRHLEAHDAGSKEPRALGQFAAAVGGGEGLAVSVPPYPRPS
jgi:hypothetical protein